MTSSPSRLPFPDVLKGILIFLVVLGHCRVYGSGVAYFEGDGQIADPVYQFIYAFHMPLFAIISGYFSYSESPAIRVWEKTKHRFRQLIVPAMAWFVLESLPKLLLTDAFTAQHLALGLLNSYWFLRVVFLLSVFTLVVRRWGGDRGTLYALGIVPFFFLPDFYGFTFYFLAFLYPFFFLGYFGRKYDQRVRMFVREHRRAIFIVATALFGGLLHFYNEDTYIYYTKFSLFDAKSPETPAYQLLLDVYRIILGTSASVSVALVMHGIYSRTQQRLSLLWAWWRRLGGESLGIYLIHVLVIEGVITPFREHLFPHWGLQVAETLFVLGVTQGIIWVLRKQRGTRQILLGIVPKPAK